MRNKGKKDVDGNYSILGQLTRKLETISNRELRQDERVWKASFEHEGAEDAGGVYNELMSSLSEEIQSTFLPLLVPTPNQINNMGTNRDC